MSEHEGISNSRPAPISRKGFLRVAAGGAAALGASGLLAGCNSAETPSTETPPATATSSPTVVSQGNASDLERPFQLHESDVLVIGGGIAGLIAAQKAVAEGATVTIVDKGPFGHSGTSGINWGHDMETNEWSEGDGSDTLGTMVAINDGLVDQEYMLSLCQHVHELQPILTNAKMGAIAERDRDGNTISQNAPAVFIADHGCFPRMFAQHARRTGIEILDRTMVTGLLQSDDGRAAGAVAVNLVNGDAHVFRAKATVMATGSYAWCYGWAGNGACTIAGPENTGDGHSMLIGLGLEMMNMEQLPFDCVQQYPEGIAYGMGGMGYAVVNYQHGLNKNGERYTQLMDDPNLRFNSILMRLTMKEINEGRGSPDGCVWVDTTDLDTMNRYYRAIKGNEFRGLGYVLPKLTEVHPEFWETAGRPALSTEGETSIPGLYYAGSGDTTYFGVAFFGATGSGYMAGKYAARRAAKTDRPNVSWGKVQDILNGSYAALERNSSDEVWPTTIYHKIQRTMFDGLSPLRDAAGIQGVIDALEKIKAEDFAKISVPSKSRRYNVEWRHALEIPNMWNCVMGTAQAALVRTETRGTHCRTDYPKMDNENWLKNIYVRLADGQWTTDIRPIIATYIPEEQVAQMVPAIGID